MTAVARIVNEEQASAWDGHEGDLWTEHAVRYERTTERHWGRFLELCPIGRADDVLDIGCGTGRSTRDAARRATDGSAIGIDLSTKMLQQARERCAADGITNATLVHGDVQVHPLEPSSIDLAISSYGCMFFGDPIAAFGNVGNAVRHGGRLALLVWRDLADNEWLSEIRGALALGRTLPVPPPGAPSPFGLADRTVVERVLGSAGFVDVTLTAIDEAIDLGDDVDDAFAFASTFGIVEGLLDGCSDEQRREGMANVRDVLATHAASDGVLLGGASWCITARRA